MDWWIDHLVETFPSRHRFHSAPVPPLLFNWCHPRMLQNHPCQEALILFFAGFNRDPEIMVLQKTYLSWAFRIHIFTQKNPGSTSLPTATSSWRTSFSPGLAKNISWESKWVPGTNATSKAEKGIIHLHGFWIHFFVQCFIDVVCSVMELFVSLSVYLFVFNIKIKCALHLDAVCTFAHVLTSMVYIVFHIIYMWFRTKEQMSVYTTKPPFQARKVEGIYIVTPHVLQYYKLDLLRCRNTIRGSFTNPNKALVNQGKSLKTTIHLLLVWFPQNGSHSNHPCYTKVRKVDRPTGPQLFSSKTGRQVFSLDNSRFSYFCRQFTHLFLWRFLILAGVFWMIDSSTTSPVLLFKVITSEILKKHLWKPQNSYSISKTPWGNFTTPENILKKNHISINSDPPKKNTKGVIYGPPHPHPHDHPPSRVPTSMFCTSNHEPT